MKKYLSQNDRVPRTIHTAMLKSHAKNADFLNSFNIEKAAGSRLYNDAGKAFIDLSSLSTNNLIGHNIRDLHEALLQHLRDNQLTADIPLEHRLGQTLCQKLHQQLPSDTDWTIEFFHADACAFEHALKTVYTYWQTRQQTKRRIFLSFAHSYHGESLSCVNFNASFANHNPFQEFLIPTEHIPYPNTWFQDPDARIKEQLALGRLQEYLEEHHQDCAALVLEPLLQTHHGMQACRPDFLNAVIKLVRQYAILVIADERLLSPMRSGHFFASQYLSHAPDMIVTGSNMTNNLCPLGTTIINDSIYAQVDTTSLRHTEPLINQLACVAANRTLDLIEYNAMKNHVHQMQTLHATRLHKLHKQPIVKNVRYLGSIGAFELICEDRSQQQRLIEWFHQQCVARNLLSSIN